VRWITKLVARLLSTAAIRVWIQRYDFARLCSLAGRYENPIPTRFLAPKDGCKIPAQTSLKTHKMGDISKEVAKTLLKCLLDYTYISVLVLYMLVLLSIAYMLVTYRQQPNLRPSMNYKR
jgi:hypothetical protein